MLENFGNDLTQRPYFLHSRGQFWEPYGEKKYRNRKQRKAVLKKLNELPFFFYSKNI